MNFEEEFKKLVQKADKEKELKKITRVKRIYLFIEIVMQLTAFSIIYFELGGLVALALFLLLTGNNLQIFRNMKKD